jgi:DNA polymerase
MSAIRSGVEPMLLCDIETYSATDLKTAGVYAYAEDPAFEILMCGWSRDGENYSLAVGEEEILKIPGLFDDQIVAHNAAFERICFSTLQGVKYQDPERYIDTAAIAAANGLPRSLKALAEALHVEAKDSAGTRLINMFSKPSRGKRIMPEDKPEAWEEFKDYCVQDVRVLVQCYRVMKDFRTSTEKKIYYVDQRINDRGILIDRRLANLAVGQADQNTARQKEEVTLLTGVENPGSVQQLLSWFETDGYPLPDMTKETVAEHLGRTGDPIRDRVLELRQDLALAANKKYVSALAMACRDGRVRGTLGYHGAHTGRWAGRGVQLQNLPAASFTDDDGEWDGEAEQAALDTLFAGGDVSAHTLKKLVRPMFTGPFTVADYAAIEARVLAWLAGEAWALQAFREGRDLYVETAKRLGSQYTRKHGKVAVLALGYQGAVNSLRVMGADGSDDELVTLVKAWRKTNRNIVNLWYRMDEVFWDGGRAGRFMRVEVIGDERHIVLPSDRRLIYRDVKRTRDGRLSFRDPRGFRQDTYGGRLVENVTQATARDILAEGLLRLEHAGLPVVAHVHDEVVVETAQRNRVVDLITIVPKWAPGLPLKAEGFTTRRYRKN